MSDLDQTHVDSDGLRVPPELREFEQQIVFRTPKSTIQHFGPSPVDPHYPMVRPEDFGDPDELSDPKNPELSPNKVSIKRQGRDAVILEVSVIDDA